MKLQERDRPPIAWDSAALAIDSGPIGPIKQISEYVGATLTIVDLEIRKLRHDPTELLTRSVQPILWLLLFGEVFTRVRGIPTGHLRYLDFMAAGILAQSALFISIFYGISVIWDRDMGILVKFLVSPASRSAQVLGKALAAGARGLAQAIIVYLLTLLLGVRLNWNPLALVGVMAFVLLGSALFSTFSLMIACLVKTQQRFMGIGQLITMPLFFASNAIYPVAIMPRWLQIISRINPLTYEVDGLRTLMLAGGTSLYGLGLDMSVLLAATAVLIVLSGKLYPTIVT